MDRHEAVNSAHDERIAELVYCIREHNRTMQETLAEIQEAKQELRELLVERGRNWADDEGYARLMSEGHRFSYDVETLDKLLMTDPLRYGWLKDYRRETIIRERVQVK